MKITALIESKAGDLKVLSESLKAADGLAAQNAAGLEFRGRDNSPFLLFALN